MPTKTVDPIGSWSAVVVKLIDPAKDHADAKRILEAFQGHEFHVGQNSILIIGRRIFGVELQLPNAIELDFRFRENLRVREPGNERPVIKAEAGQSIRVVFSSRRPDGEAEREMIRLVIW